MYSVQVNFFSETATKD